MSLKQAWENIMILAINEGLKRNIFTLDANTFQEGNMKYEFDYNGFLISVHVKDIGYDEIRIDVEIDLDKNGKYKFHDLSGHYGYGLHNYNAIMFGYLERRTGKYLMRYSKINVYKINKDIKQYFSKLNIEPNGFERTGKFL